MNTKIAGAATALVASLGLIVLLAVLTSQSHTSATELGVSAKNTIAVANQERKGHVKTVRGNGLEVRDAALKRLQENEEHRAHQAHLRHKVVAQKMDHVKQQNAIHVATQHQHLAEEDHKQDVGENEDDDIVSPVASAAVHKNLGEEGGPPDEAKRIISALPWALPIVALLVASLVGVSVWSVKKFKPETNKSYFKSGLEPRRTARVPY